MSLADKIMNLYFDKWIPVEDIRASIKRIKEKKFCLKCGSKKLNENNCPCGRKYWVVEVKDIDEEIGSL